MYTQWGRVPEICDGEVATKQAVCLLWMGTQA